MAVSTAFSLKPLACYIKLTVMVPLVLYGTSVAARPVNGPETITVSNPLESYQIGSLGHLTANAASTLDITTQTGARLTLNATTVTATGNRAAVQLLGAEAWINGGTLTSETDALVLGHEADRQVGSRATVIGATLSGTNRGALVSTLSDLHLEGATLIGSGASGRGLEVIGNGRATAYGSTISGQMNGIRLLADSVGAKGDLTLDSTHVKGVDGAAIAVGMPGLAGQATIKVGNGSTLVGGNGRLMEVATGSTADLTVDNSQLTGDVVVEQGGAASLTLQNRASLTGRLENVAQLAVNSQARWNMVGDGQIANLVMDGGSIRFGEAADYYRLSVDKLSGNGTFVMDVDFSQAQTDFLDITGHATGEHSVLIGSTGTDPLADARLHVVHAGAGDARFTLAGGPVDLGTWSYDLIKQGENDWFLDASSRTVSPGTASVIALFNTAPTVWYGEMSTLRSRMGELRMHGGQPGVWIRAHSNRFDLEGAAGVGYRQNQHGVSLGIDTALPLGDGQWLAGVMVGQSTSDLDLDRGSSGKVDSYSTGAYATWLDTDTGYYFDGVLKLNHLRNSANVNLSDGTRTKGDYANWGAGASAEAGRHIKLDQDWFVEPYAQLAAVVFQGKDYTLDNGMRAEGERARSLTGKLGATAGRDFDLGQGRTLQPYGRAALAHEFVKHNQVEVNGNRFDNNLSGSRAELGVGVALGLSEALQVHADFEYSNGSRLEQPWGANLGVRYAW